MDKQQDTSSNMPVPLLDVTEPAEGRPTREIIRCLKRVLAREIFQRVMADYRARQAADLAA